MKNNLVYHYTSTDTFWHLIESIKYSKDKDSFIFRATHVFFMNDPQEFIYGQKILENVFFEIESELDIDDEYKLSILLNEADKMNSDRDKSLLNYLKNQIEMPFVISFSRLEDNLPMWLNYGNGGKGINLVFEDNRNQPFKVKFIDGKRVPYESFYTSDVYYSDIPKDSSLYKLIYDTMKDYKKDIDDGIAIEPEIYLDALVQIAAPLIKTSYYENEKEARVFKSVAYDFLGDVGKIEFRFNGYNNLVPYIGIEIPVNQLKAVRIGPLANYELTRMAIELMKKRYNLQFDILSSKVQYREY